MIRVTINHRPVAKSRPRATVINGRVRMYTPAKTREWEELVANAISQHCEQQGIELPLTGAIRMRATFILPKPASARNREYPIVKPDLDNFAKALMDAITRAGLWKDDSQVVVADFAKFYTEGREEPCVIVEITEEIIHDEA